MLLTTDYADYSKSVTGPVRRTLRAQDWTVLRIREHEFVRKNQARPVRRIRRALAG